MSFSWMQRLRVLGVLCAACLAFALAPVRAESSARPAVRLAAFHSRFGSPHFGGGLFSRRRTYGYGYRGRYYSRPSLLHRIVRAAAFAYILHLLFTNGVFSVVVWLLILAVLSRLFRRRNRRYLY